MTKSAMQLIKGSIQTGTNINYKIVCIIRS